MYKYQIWHGRYTDHRFGNCEVHTSNYISSFEEPVHFFAAYKSWDIRSAALFVPFRKVIKKIINLIKSSNSMSVLRRPSRYRDNCVGMACSHHSFIGARIRKLSKSKFSLLLQNIFPSVWKCDNLQSFGCFFFFLTKFLK